jgi:hypothetical protein
MSFPSEPLVLTGAVTSTEQAGLSRLKITKTVAATRNLLAGAPAKVEKSTLLKKENAPENRNMRALSVFNVSPRF